jgi:spore coat polysaccharide biosynthesis protein SpsF
MNAPTIDRRAADVFIQVRVGSNRLPGKALDELGDRSCIGQVITRARHAREIREVVVCTSTSSEDAVLLREADTWGAASFTGELDNCLKRFLDCAEQRGSEIVVRVCGDSPLMPPTFIDAVVTHLRETGADYARMVSVPVGTGVEAFTVCALERALSAAVDPSLSDDLMYFIGRTEINDLAEVEPSDPMVCRPDLILALNRPEDLVLLQTVFRECEPAGAYLTLEEPISFLDDHPGLRDSNKPYVRKATRCDTRLDPDRLAKASLATCGESRRVS